MSLTKTPELLIPPSVPSAPPSVQPWPTLPGSQPEMTPRPGTRKRPKWLQRRVLMATGAIAVLSMGTYVGVTWMGNADAAAGIQLFQVSQRSFPITFQERGELKAASIVDVRCPLEGKSTIITLAPEGTQVKKGDLLVELASDEIEEKLRDAEIKVATAKAAHEAAVKELQILKDKNQSEVDKAKLTLWLAEQALEKYENGESVQLKQADELALEKAKYVLDRAEKKLEDSKKLYAKGFITRIELQNDEFEVYQGKLELKKAELAYKVTEDYTIRMALEEKKSAVVEAKKEVARAEKAREASEAKAVADEAAKAAELKLVEDRRAKLSDQKSKARVLALADGLVIYSREDWDEEPRTKVGAQVVERQKMIELPDTSSMKATIRVPEAKIEHLKLGLSATIQIEGFSGRQFTGKVSRIAALADSRNWFNRNQKEYETDILLDGTFTELKPGTSAKVEILVTELNNVLAVPVQSIFGKAGRYYVFVDESGSARPVEVKLGLSSTEFAEVKEGLKEGDIVRLAISDDLKLKLPGGNEPAADAEEGDRPNRRRTTTTRPAVISTQPAAAPERRRPATRPGPA